MTKNIDEIIKVIEGSIYKEDYFFQKASAMDNPFPLLKRLKDKGYFDPSKNPELKKDPKNKEFFFPKWNVLGYLENVSVKNAKNPDIEVTGNLIDIIESIINFRNNNGERVENYRTDQSIIKIIFKLPIKLIKESYFQFIGLALRSEFGARIIEFEIEKTVFPRLIEDQAVDLIIELLNIILDYKLNDTGYMLEFESVIDDYILGNMLDEYKPKIADLCCVEAANVGINKIEEIMGKDKIQFDYIQIPTIEDHPQSRYLEDYELQLVCFVRDMLESADPNQIRDLIINLKKEKYSIFNRVAIHIINYHYEKLNEIFWDSKENPLNDFKLKHELYELFRSQASNFSSEQMSILVNWIETKDYDIPPENIDLTEKIEAYRKKVWLEPLLSSGNETVKILYDKYHQINPAKIEHPGFNIWFSGFSASKSSLEKSAFFVKSNEDIANYFISYIKEGPLYSEFTLAQTFRESVIEKPGKFARNIKPFLNVKPRYQHALLWGFQEAWKKHRNFQWKTVFNFILELISSEDFWTGNDKYNTWTISIIADLIKEGTKSDDNAFDPELLPAAKEILMIIVNKTKSDLNDKPKNIVFDVLNSVKGKIFSAMINYSLRQMRLLPLPKERKWDQTIKNDFSMRLDQKNEPTLEFIFILAQYLPNLCYLDNKWVKDNINLIFDKNDDNRWVGAFTGYLYYSNEFRENIYLLLKSEGHYDKAIETDFSDRRITWRLVQHICSFYLIDKEKLDDENSLIYALVEKGSSEKLSDVVNFISRKRKNITDETRTKIKPLWKKIFDKASENENNGEYQQILSDLSKWLSLVEVIDRDSFEWLKHSAKYIDKSFNFYIFIKCLLIHVKNSPAEVGELYLVILENDIYPNYKIEDIQRLIENLYIMDQIDIANRICYLHERKGIYFLEEIYKKFN